MSMNHRSANLPEFSLPSLHAPSRLDSTGLRRPPSGSPGSHLPRRRGSFTDYPDTTRTSTQKPNRGTPPPQYHTSEEAGPESFVVVVVDGGGAAPRPLKFTAGDRWPGGALPSPYCYASDGGGHSSGAAAAEEWRGRGDAKEGGNGESGKEEIVCLGDSEKKVNPFLSTLFFFTPLLLLLFFPLWLFFAFTFSFLEIALLSALFIFAKFLLFVSFSSFFCDKKFVFFFHI